MNDLQTSLLVLLDYVNKYAHPHRFLPYVAESLNAMIEELENNGVITKKLRELALGLGLFISDDFEFSESDTGTKILEVINPILRSEE